MYEIDDTDPMVSTFVAQWNANRDLKAEDFLRNQKEFSTPTSQQFRKLLEAEVALRFSAGEQCVSKTNGEVNESPDLDSTIPYSPRGSEPLDLKANETVTDIDVHDMVIKGRYRVQRILGKGGFGIVYQAHDRVLKRDVAIKMLHDRRTVNSNQRESLEREAQMISSLDHPHIVPVWDFDWDTDGHPFIVSRYVPSRNLKQSIQSSRPSYSRSAAICSAIARALHHAHSKDIIHRDVKPGNILIDENGHAWLTDFGLGTTSDSSANSEAIAGGTIIYMSPEQVAKRGGVVSWQSDIFSLGIVFYELLTGINPFAGDDLEEVERRLQQDVKPCRLVNESVPKKFDDICLQALRRNPTERFPTALDFADALERVMTYVPQPIDVSGIRIPDDVQELMEILAQNNHDVWSQQRIAEGWQVGDTRNDSLKTNPDLVPYEELSEQEKDYDRRTVETTIKAILATGYQLRQI